MKETKLMEIYINEAGNVQCRWDKGIPLHVGQAGALANYCAIIHQAVIASLANYPNAIEPLIAPEEKMPWE
jgi:hypothetical protein